MSVSKNDRKKNMIKNDDIVSIIVDGDKEVKYRFGDLKQDFLSHKLTSKYGQVGYILFKGCKYRVTVKPTQGIRFEKIQAKPVERLRNIEQQGVEPYGHGL